MMKSLEKGNKIKFQYKRESSTREPRANIFDNLPKNLAGADRCVSRAERTPKRVALVCLSLCAFVSVLHLSKMV